MADAVDVLTVGQTETSSGEQPWRTALRPPADSRRVLAPRSAWAILALASGDARFAARVAAGLSKPEASRARARLRADGLISLLPLLSARAGRVSCTTSDPEAVSGLRQDIRLLPTASLHEQPQLEAYVRIGDLPALVDDYGLHAGRDQDGGQVLLRTVADPWPFPETARVPDLVQALDLLEFAVSHSPDDQQQALAAWAVIEAHATRDVPSWYRATRPPRARQNTSLLALKARSRAARPSWASRTADADTLSAMLFAVGDPVRRADLLAATGWTPPRLQTAVDALVAEPPRGLKVQVDGNRLHLLTDGTARAAVERLLARLKRGEVLQPLDLPEMVWLVLAIIVIEQPITRADITSRRLADSDRQVQALLQEHLIREEPRATLPGRGIPLITTDLLLRRVGVGSIGELQQRMLAQAPEPQAAPADEVVPQ